MIIEISKTIEIAKVRARTVSREASAAAAADTPLFTNRLEI